MKHGAVHEEPKYCAVFLEFCFLFLKVGSFLPRGIEMLFFRNCIKQIFTARRPRSFFGKHRTNIFARIKPWTNLMYLEWMTVRLNFSDAKIYDPNCEINSDRIKNKTFIFSLLYVWAKHIFLSVIYEAEFLWVLQWCHHNYFVVSSWSGLLIDVVNKFLIGEPNHSKEDLLDIFWDPPGTLSSSLMIEMAPSRPFQSIYGGALITLV